MNFKTFISTGFAIQITLTLPAATLTVTSLGDNVPGCLRDMVTGSNPGDTIEFGVTGVIVLSGRIPVTKLLYIHGPGPGKLAIDANRAGRAFITGPNPVEISNLTISNGLVVGVNGADAMMPGMNGQNGDHAYGGAILTTGDLLISNCWIHANTVIGGDGGSGGEYIPAASTQPGNGGAGGDAAGAAVYLDTFNSVDITAIKCTFSANIAMGGNGGMGGANNNLSIVKPGGDGGNGGGAADGSGNLSYVTNCTFSGDPVLEIFIHCS